MGNVYYKQVKDLEMLMPSFKIASAIVHFDETSPHMHIVGIPIKEKIKNGMEKQIGKSDVFTKESLKNLQDKMRTLCIDEFNETYQLDNSIKKKQKGRNRDINVKDTDDYENLKTEIEVSKNSIYNFNKKLKNIKLEIKQAEELFNNLEKSRFNQYTIFSKNKDKIDKFIKDTKISNEEFKSLINILTSIEVINNNLKYQKIQNKELRNKNDALVIRINAKDKENKDLKNIEDFQQSIINSYKKDKIDLLKLISKNIHDDNNLYKLVAKDLCKHRIISKSEYKLCLRPIFNLSSSEINSALSRINNEMDESAESFYNINADDDYML